MRERPIVMKAHEVRAVLAGRKTQTRRGVKPQDAFKPYDDHRSVTPGLLETGEWAWCADGHECVGIIGRCPLGAPGDRLWVREAWRCGEDGVIPSSAPLDRSAHYRADLDEPDALGCWRPSIHMPRWASRLTLEIVSIRVERVQAISDADIAAEGVDAEAVEALFDSASRKARREVLGDDIDHPGMKIGQRPPRDLWRIAWTLLHGAESWERSDWCWAVEFRRTP